MLCPQSLHQSGHIHPHAGAQLLHSNMDTMVTNTEVSSNISLCLDERLDANLLFFPPCTGPFSVVAEDAFVKQLNEPWDRNEHKGELRDCQSHHPEVTLVVVAAPLPRHFPPRLKSNSCSPKQNSQSHCRQHSLTGFFPRKFKLKQAPRAANVEVNA